MGLVSDVVGIGADLYNIYNQNRNYNLQKENLDYQKRMQA